MECIDYKLLVITSAKHSCFSTWLQPDVNTCRLLSKLSCCRPFKRTNSKHRRSSPRFIRNLLKAVNTVLVKGAGTPVLANLHRFCKLHKIHTLHKNQGLFQLLT